MSDVSYLKPGERAQLDQSKLRMLEESLGPSAAEEVVCRAMEDIGLRLCQLEDRIGHGPRESLHRELRAIRAIAEQIGLTSIFTVAGDAMACVERGDPVAEAATLARLSRIGERSLMDLWNLQGLSV